MSSFQSDMFKAMTTKQNKPFQYLLYEYVRNATL